MDEGLRLFLWLLVGNGSFGSLCAVYGAVAGTLRWQEGHASGTVVGLSVQRAFERVREQELSVAARGALVGGADGLVFGLVLGTITGLVIAWYGGGEWPVLRGALLTTTAIALAAVSLGLFAGLVTRTGPRALVGMFVGCISGAMVGLAWAGAMGLMVGAISGSLIGVVGALVVR